MSNDEITYVEGGALNDHSSPSVSEGQGSSNHWNDYTPDPFGWDSLPGSEHLPSKRGWTLPSGRSITAPFPGQEESYFRWSENKMAEGIQKLAQLDAQRDHIMEQRGMLDPAFINARNQQTQQFLQQQQVITPKPFLEKAQENIINGYQNAVEYLRQPGNAVSTFVDHAVQPIQVQGVNVPSVGQVGYQVADRILNPTQEMREARPPVVQAGIETVNKYVTPGDAAALIVGGITRNKNAMIAAEKITNNILGASGEKTTLGKNSRSIATTLTKQITSNPFLRYGAGRVAGEIGDAHTSSTDKKHTIEGDFW